jgi:hypothetical protein
MLPTICAKHARVKMDPDIFLIPDVVFDYVTLFELNIHLSESVVRLVARTCGLDYANILVIGKADPVAEPNTDAATLEATGESGHFCRFASRTACFLPGIIVSAAA